MKSTMAVLSLVLLLPAVTAHAQGEADTQAINKLIDEFSRLQDSGDMLGQSKLMAENRVWIAWGLGRMTDQAQNMKRQQANLDAVKAAVPNVKWFTDARDRLIKFYGGGAVAVASFYWYRQYVAPADLPEEKLKVLGPQPAPVAITHVLEKQGGSWTIVHTHISNLTPTLPEN